MADSPTIEASALHLVSREEALAFVDKLCGPPESWPSRLMSYRLEADFQSIWKEEVGHMLKTAERFGFLDKVKHDIEYQAKNVSKDTGEIDPNDPSHLKLHQHLAATRITYYLTGTGWGYVGYEPETGGSIDIDISLSAPDGRTVELQVKAPDQWGERANHQVVKGEDDSRVVKALDKAVKQLRRPATRPAFIAVCTNRTRAFALDPRAALWHLVGSTNGYGRGRTGLPAANRGHFFSDEWTHVSGVIFLDFEIGRRDFDEPEDRVNYPCTVLLNHRATFPAPASWFPHARVLYLEGEIFHWANGSPTRGLPDGTFLEP